MTAALPQFLGHVAKALFHGSAKRPFSHRIRKVWVDFAIFEQPPRHREMAIPDSSAKSLAKRLGLPAEMRFDQFGDGNVAADRRMVEECETMRSFGRRRGGIGG